jgi:dsRNA-specific ribonuclease
MLLANSDSRPPPQLHPKTWLLELGGRVTSSREGGEDHMPLWVAEAECFGKKHRVGPLASKKLAEAVAAEGLLRKLSIMM